MQQQQDFWPVRKAADAQSRWDALSIENRANLIAALARQIAKVICPKLMRETEEENREQQ